jgi:hypothetical protein
MNPKHPLTDNKKRKCLKCFNIRSFFYRLKLINIYLQYNIIMIQKLLIRVQKNKFSHHSNFDFSIVSKINVRKILFENDLKKSSLNKILDLKKLENFFRESFCIPKWLFLPKDKLNRLYPFHINNMYREILNGLNLDHVYRCTNEIENVHDLKFLSLSYIKIILKLNK